MTWRIATYDLSGLEVVNDLPWQSFNFAHVLNGPGSFSAQCSMTRVTRDDVEPGQRDVRIYEDATLRWAGRIWDAMVDTSSSSQTVKLIGEGIASVLAKRLINWQARYEPKLESPPNLNTVYGADTSQELILLDLVNTTQLEDGGDLGIIAGIHTGGSHKRRRWYCAEDGIFISEVFDDFASLTDGVDWAITPTLTDDALLELATWNPKRGTDLSGTVVLNPADYLDNFSYEIDAHQVVSRGRAVGAGHQMSNGATEECEPVQGDVTDDDALADYGLLEDFEGSDSDDQNDVDELAASLLSPKSLVGADLWYELPRGPALGDCDIGDVIRIVENRVGWEFDISARLQEIEVRGQLPNDAEHTFVRFGFSEDFAYPDLGESS